MYTLRKCTYPYPNPPPFPPINSIFRFKDTRHLSSRIEGGKNQKPKTEKPRTGRRDKTPPGLEDEREGGKNKEEKRMKSNQSYLTHIQKKEKKKKGTNYSIYRLILILLLQSPPPLLLLLIPPQIMSPFIPQDKRPFPQEKYVSDIYMNGGTKTKCGGGEELKMTSRKERREPRRIMREKNLGEKKPREGN
jgi:hypothetical protein